MSRRIEIVDTVRNCNCSDPDYCKGTKEIRTVLEGIPEIWWCVEHEANGFDTYCHRALAWDIAHDDENEKTMPNCRMELRGLVAAVFGETS